MNDPVIDTDIHPVPDPERIAEFLPPLWRDRYLSGNRGPGSLGYWNPNGVMRRDAVLDDGTRIEAQPAALLEHHFDAFNIAYGILNVAGFAFILSPEPDYAASLAAATNDVFIADWLPRDPRLRMSLVVPMGDPDLAAREIHRVGDHPGVVQVLLPGGSPMPYGKRYFHPIYAAAVEHNLPVALHPGPEGVGISGQPLAAGYPGSYLEWHTGWRLCSRTNS